MPRNSILIIVTLFVVSSKSIEGGVHDNEIPNCNLSKGALDEIESYANTVKSIIDTAVNGDFKSVTYNELAKFVDTFGSRKAATQNLENAIDYMMNISKSFNLDNVHGEKVSVPNWIRGKESATLLKPRVKNLSMLSLGFSVGTRRRGIEADVLVVRSFEDLRAKAHLAKGKIIVYNQDYVSYRVTAAYRSRGATEAAKVGGVASLIRSITPFSLNSPHTGMQTYGDNVTKIPTACITVEDAHLLQRFQDRGETIRIRIKMKAKQFRNEVSRNTIVEIEGTEKPEQVVIISGHLDSWDVGEGAMDDGGGVFITWAALVLLKSLNLRPTRTIRGIFWTAEEFGLVGASAYAAAHANETDNFNFIMECDEGTFNPLGIEYSAGEQGGCILEEVLKLLAPINATQAVNSSSDIGSDITIWTRQGVPGAALLNENEKYFWYHHSEADTMDIQDPAVMDKATALWASVAYVLADLSFDFPRN